MSEKSKLLALDFIENEKQFHLGFLPTEQSSPLTKHLDREFARSTADGVKNLQLVDRNVAAMAKRIFASEQFSIRCSNKSIFLSSGHWMTLFSM